MFKNVYTQAIYQALSATAPGSFFWTTDDTQPVNVMTSPHHGALDNGHSSQTHLLMTIVNVLILVVSYCSCDGQRVPFVSPYFYLCNYDGATDQSNIEVGEVALSVSVENDPEFYIPGELYKG